MSVKILPTYTIICDNCGKSADEDSDFSSWDEVVWAREDATEAGYIEHDGGDYCNDCYCYDDDDNLVIKAKPMITDVDKLNCAVRELLMRKRAYPRWVESGRMKPEVADMEIKVMQAIVLDYRNKVAPDLFIGMSVGPINIDN